MKEEKAELIYALVVLIVMSLLIIGGAMYHPRSKYKSQIEINE